MENIVCKHCCTKIKNLSVSLEGKSVLNDINLHIHCGQLMAIVGPNGAGKTTLLRALLGEIKYQGKLEFDFKGTGNLKTPKFGYVPQKINLDPGSPISVLDVLSVLLTRAPVWLHTSGKIRERAVYVLSRVKAEKLIDKCISTLSGGELQRVLLAMAITPEPELLLLDEPVSGIDLNGLGLFYELVDELRHKMDMAIILVSHDIKGVSAFADTMVFLNHHILAQGKPADVLANAELIKTFDMVQWGNPHHLYTEGDLHV
ncbi:MAG: metal ABC transporter ATP-binding protein [Candidatus Margulisbacteria bacterium]|nr:metal ABC transporter ATP-binding protein [Candidatus Margulisiibacteriota bacterium]